MRGRRERAQRDRPGEEAGGRVHRQRGGREQREAPPARQEAVEGMRARRDEEEREAADDHGAQHRDRAPALTHRRQNHRARRPHTYDHADRTNHSARWSGCIDHA
eukprot:524495-Pleurochrysis_carterae.AAC.3